MAVTSSIILTETWQLVAAGACVVQEATQTEAALPAELAGTTKCFETKSEDLVLVSVGSSLPAASDFGYLEFAGLFEYPGTSNVYMRMLNDSRTYKVLVL